MSSILVLTKEIEKGILSVQINNDKKRNALSDSIKYDLERIALDLRDNTDIQIVILFSN